VAFPADDVDKARTTAESDTDVTLAENEYEICVAVALDLHDMWLDAELAPFTLSLELIDDLADPMRFAVLTILLDLIECRTFPDRIREESGSILDLT
jgi:hypothetical protein